MAVMFGSLYDALRAAGAPDDKAQRAAEEIAAQSNSHDVAFLQSDVSALKRDSVNIVSTVTQLKTDNAVLKWMVGFNLAFTVALIGLVFRGMH